MNTSDLLAEIAQAGGTIDAIGDKLKFQRVPARLVPVIKQNKAKLLAELQSVNIVNLVNIDSGHLPPPRIVLGSESKFTELEVMAETLLTTMRQIGVTVSMTPDGRLSLKPESLLWDSDGELIAELEPQLVTLLEQKPQPAPATVTCGSCVRFQPGTTPLGIGRCLATVDGLPPKGGSGYKAAFPMAVRSCSEFSGVQP